jgi:hypothetical protein
MGISSTVPFAYVVAGHNRIIRRARLRANSVPQECSRVRPRPETLRRRPSRIERRTVRWSQNLVVSRIGRTAAVHVDSLLQRHRQRLTKVPVILTATGVIIVAVTAAGTGLISCRPNDPPPAMPPAPGRRSEADDRFPPDMIAPWQFRSTSAARFDVRANSTHSSWR